MPEKFLVFLEPSPQRDGTGAWCAKRWLHTVFNHEPQLSCLWLPATSKGSCITSTLKTVLYRVVVLLLYCWLIVYSHEYYNSSKYLYVVCCVLCIPGSYEYAAKFRSRWGTTHISVYSFNKLSYLRPRPSALCVKCVMLSYFVRSYSIHLVVRVLFLSTLRAAPWGVPPPKWGRSRPMVS